MMKKRIISSILVLVMLIGIMPTFSVANAAISGTTGACTWSLNGTVFTISGNGNMGDYSYSCGPWGSSITEVIITKGVTSIGSDAFEDCYSLTSVNIPDSVTSIGSDAFYYCKSLTSIVIPDSVTSIGSHAFYYCKSLTSIVIGDSVTSIGNFAFSYCSSLTSVVIGNSVTSIGNYAFYYCSSLKSVVIPNSVTSIGDRAFYHCTSLTNIQVSEDNQTYSSENGVLFDKDKTELIFCPEGKSGEYVIPDSVTSIGSSAFYDCSSLKSVVIGNSVTSIGSSAFEYCTALTSIVIPDSVTSIGNYAFYGTAWYNNQLDGRLIYAGKVVYTYKGICPSNVVIKDGTLGIADGAFEGCYSLTSIVIPDSVTSIGRDVFYGTAWYNNQPDGRLIYAGKVVYEYKGTCPSNVVIKDGTLGIAGGAFSSCKSLTSIVIPDSVTSIGYYAFFSCDSLTSVYYTGSKTDKSQITIGSSNSYLTDATWHYNVIVEDGHVYDNESDRECNICDFIKCLQHTYDNACDTDCNECGFQRVTSHNFSEKYNATYHWLICLDCRTIVDKNQHEFENVCDSTCQDCSYVRDEGHNFLSKTDDNAHWNQCTKCNEIIDYAEHLFDNDYDATCNGCDHVRYVEIPEIECVSVTLNNSLAYKVKVSGIVESANTKVIFTVGNKTYTVKNYTTQDELFVFTLKNIAPHLMTEDITAKLVVSIDGEELYTREYTTSLEQYCLAVAEADSSYRDIVNAVLNYGAAAQTYKNYKTDILANRTLSDADKEITKNKYFNGLDKEYFPTSDSTVTWKSAGLYLDSKASIKLSFETDQDLKDATVLVENEWLDQVAVLKNCIVKENGRYVFYFDGFNVNELDKTFLFTICKDGKPISDTLSYSVESYAYRANLADDDSLKNLMSALINYGKLSKNY